MSEFLNFGLGKCDVPLAGAAQQTQTLDVHGVVNKIKE